MGTKARNGVSSKFSRITYLKHLKNVRDAKPIVDDKPPVLITAHYFSDQKCNEDEKRMLEIDLQNKILLQHINAINREGGRVDCYLEKPTKTIGVRGNKEMVERRKIERENRQIYRRIQTKPATYVTEDYAKDWERIENILEHMAHYPLLWKQKKYYDPLIPQSAQSISLTLAHKRPRCYFDLKVDNGRDLGRIVFELYDDFVPITVENFRSLCVGFEGLSYKNCPIHRVISGYMCIGGDITHFNGAGGTSIYGEVFDDEDFSLTHAVPGAISMANVGPDTNNSQFIITFKKLYTLDNVNVVFGRVVKGIKNLQQVQEYSSKYGKPLMPIIISNCGEC